MWSAVKAMLHPDYDQPDATSVDVQFDRLLNYVGKKLPQVVEHLNAARTDLLAFTACPKDLWIQIQFNIPVKRLNEIRRSIDSVGNFPTREGIVRPVGALLAKHSEE